jgi:2-polyprenyl-6-methoxyphenol hydroxylase-like FAD-dependent oxidoreductase
MPHVREEIVTEIDVVVAGGGPNGLMLACELALQGVRVVVLEQLPEPATEPKANGLVGQVVRLLYRRGLLERITGSPAPPVPNRAHFAFAALGLDLSVLDDSPLYTVGVPQPRLTAILFQRALELGVDVRMGHELVGLAQSSGEVTADVTGPAGPYSVSCRYLVGADGGHSATRKLAGIAFPGVTHDRVTSRAASVGLAGAVPGRPLDVPGYGQLVPFVPQRTEHGTITYAPFPGRAPLISTAEWDQPAPTADMTLDELSGSIQRVLGGVALDIEPPSGDGPAVLRRMHGGNVRVADRFRAGRVFLLGDAAHVGTAGGSGLNLGMQEAANLGWKLAVAVNGRAPDGLLDSYESECRPPALRMVMNAQAQGALTAPGKDVTALRELFGELLRLPSVVAHVAALISGSDVTYGQGDHPLVGRFAPDLTVAWPVRPLLVDLTPGRAAASALSTLDGRLDVITDHDPVPGATALLIRPDSYVAWATSSPTPDLSPLHTTLSHWFALP